MRYFLLSLALVLFLAGAVFHASAASHFAITSPLFSDQVQADDVIVTFSTPPGFQLTDYVASPRPTLNQGHIHLWVDDSPTPIEVTSSSTTLSHLPFGDHLLVAELVTNRHTSLIPKTVTSVSFSTLTPPPTPDYSRAILKTCLLLIILASSTLYLVSQQKKSHTRKKRSK